MVMKFSSEKLRECTRQEKSYILGQFTDYDDAPKSTISDHWSKSYKTFMFGPRQFLDPAYKICSKTYQQPS